MPGRSTFYSQSEHAAARINSGEAITIGGVEIDVTPVFYAYWNFAAERQRIFNRRLTGETANLTNDPILREFKFTNAYRASDRVSQYLIKHVIYRDDLPRDEANIFFRVLLFKLFNKIETWTFLERELGPITWETYDFEIYDDALSRRLTTGERIYSAAYIMPSGGTVFGHRLKHQNHLRMLEYAIVGRFASRLAEANRMVDAFELLKSIPFIGPFLAYQYATDLNYSELTNFREDEFTVAGPGAIDGIHKCFVGAENVRSSDVIRYMWENQERHFSALDINFDSLWGRPLQLIDCQNIFCEISKYARVAFPEYTGVSGRTRIKQKFRASSHPLEPWYPPKWGINDRIVSLF